MRLLFTCLFAFLVAVAILSEVSAAQDAATSNLSAETTAPNAKASGIAGSTIALHAISTANVASEMGGAFMTPAKCDADGNLYLRKFAMDRPMLGPVVKINPEGKRVALFDLSGFSQLALDRADTFSPASDGGVYQIAQSGILKPRIYVLHFASDGSPASPTRLDADFEIYTFAAFSGGNFLVSGVKRDVQNKDDRGRNFTAVFSADGRELAQLSWQDTGSAGKTGAKSDGSARQPGTSAGTESAEKSSPTLDLSDAEVGADGNLYVMRSSSPAMVTVIGPSGKILRALKVGGPRGAMPTAFHVSGNRMAITFWNEESESQTMVIADAQTGRKISSYSDPVGAGTTFACYEANEGVFTFLKLGEGNALLVVRAEAQ
jgi:hypothetical protein